MSVVSDQDINRPGHTNANEPPVDEEAAPPVERAPHVEPAEQGVTITAFALTEGIALAPEEPQTYGEIRVFIDGVELKDIGPRFSERARREALDAGGGWQIAYTKKKRPRSP